jgi:tetratricopeptide (TPR) repeat protein
VAGNTQATTSARYWASVTLWEAAIGLGDEAAERRWGRRVRASSPRASTLATRESHARRLQALVDELNRKLPPPAPTPAPHQRPTQRRPRCAATARTAAIAMKPHAFIAMPFGTKPGPDGQAIDFNRVLAELIRPALEAAGCEVFRADEESRAGDIRVDMFQELLVADLVVADLTLANANVWYELGVRHALRARGVVLLYGADAAWGRDAESAKAFDTYTERKLRYHLSGGGPEADQLQADRERLAAMARDTLATSTRRKVSPVYALLPHLEQPQWRRLLLADANEFSDAYNDWARRMQVARQRNRPGDIMTLAKETPTRALALEAKRDAGNCLLQLQQPGLALEQYEAALAIDPDDVAVRQKKAICLGRLGRYEEAREWTKALTRDHPSDAECWALAGRSRRTTGSAAGACPAPSRWCSRTARRWRTRVWATRSSRTATRSWPILRTTTPASTP